MRIIVDISDADQRVMGVSPTGCAMQVHALVRREARRLGGPGTTSVEFQDSTDRTMREYASGGIVTGPYEVKS